MPKKEMFKLAVLTTTVKAPIDWGDRRAGEVCDDLVDLLTAGLSDLTTEIKEKYPDVEVEVSI